MVCAPSSIRLELNSSTFLSSSYTNRTKLVCISLNLCGTEVLSKMAEFFSHTGCTQLSQMFLAILFFHSSEYILAVWAHGKSNVTLSSLLISKGYLVAMAFSVLEYTVEMWLFPQLKQHWWISNFGLTMVVVGELVRKLAIITAGGAFTHLIRTRHEEQHKLITYGVYSFVRHPSYLAFLVWSVGTQIMLCNPVSTVGFAVVVWRFFSHRIPYEEFYLRRFFRSDYDEYAQRTPSGVPFVK
ncbi:Protein-S-isoprenylcysteine O-methyltransferase B [Linum grandiflorum]